MTQALYVVQKLPRVAERGNRWRFFREHADGSQMLLGFYRKRKEALVVAKLLAGWRGKVEVRDKAKDPELPRAWRVTTQ